MKTSKWMTALVTLALVFTFATCDSAPSQTGEIEYTDVVYSQDGSTVTLYLDGVGVPVTDDMRALNRQMAAMNYEFLEVVFVGNAGASIARTSWYIGERAGISGVYRPAPGVDYSYTDVTTANTNGGGAALIFVGMNDRTLLGIGNLSHIDDPSGTQAGNVASGAFLLTPTSSSVTFTVTAIKTFLNPTSATTTTVATGNTFETATLAAATTTATLIDRTAVSSTNTSATYITTGEGLQFPIYSLPAVTSNTVAVQTAATYTFQGDRAADDPLGATFPFTNGVLRVGAGTVLPRSATYRVNGQPRTLTQNLYTDIAIALTNNDSVVGTGASAAFIPAVGLRFTATKAEVGLFAFNISIPVNALTVSASTVDATITALRWNVKTGWDQYFYSLDNGNTVGGLTLMSIGDAQAIDWLEIYVVGP